MVVPLSRSHFLSLDTRRAKKGGIDFFENLLNGPPVANDDNGFEMVCQGLELSDLSVGQCHTVILSAVPQLN